MAKPTTPPFPIVLAAAGDMPPVIPACCDKHRRRAFDLIETLLLNDAVGRAAQLMASGYTADAARTTVDNEYRAWLADVERLVTLGTDIVSDRHEGQTA